MGQVEPAIAAEPLDVSKINQLKRSLEDKLQSLSDLDQGILELTPEDLIVTEIVQADEIRERLYAALSKLELCLSPTIPHGRAHTTDPPTTDPPAVDPPATDPSTTDPPAVDPPATHPPAADLPATDPPDPAASGTTHGPNVKLPKISLPRFNGNPVKWTPFWDSFQSAIHLNTEISDVDKFSYLRSLLDSTAYDAIAGLTLSTANYQQAVEFLCKRFGNKQVIISNHMDTPMNMDAVSSDRHIKDLRSRTSRRSSFKGHPLPHLAIMRQDKSTTRLRVVYDASAKSANSPSLNNCLLKSPKFNQLIFDLLVRF